MLISWKPKVEARSQRYKLEAKDVPKAYKLGKKKPRGECTQYPQCAFLYVFTYVKRIRFSVRKRTKMDTQILQVLYAHSIRNFCTFYLQIPE